MTYMHCNHCGRERQHKWIGEQDMPKGKFDWYVCCKCNDSQAVAQSGFVVLSDDPNTGQTVATWGQAKIYPTKEQVRDIMAVPGKWESGKRKAEVPVQKRRGLFG